MDETSASPATPVAADDLAAATIATAPEPTSGTVKPQTPPAGPELGSPVEKDSLNRPYDPAKFSREKDKLGRWKNLNAGRKGGHGASPESASRDPAAGNGVGSSSVIAPDAPTPKGPDKYDLAADMYCRAFYATADSLFAGKGEWAPDNDPEHVGLRDAAAAYLRAKGMEDLPPGPALLLAVATYSAKRIQRPNTNTRWRMILDYWRARFASWRSGRKIAAQPAP